MRKMLRTQTLQHFNFKPLIPIPLLLIFSLTSRPATSHVFIYAGCSQEKYQSNSVFETNLNSLLSSLLSSSSQASYNNFAIANDTSPDSAIYGLYQCRGDLNLQECTKCIQSVISQIGLVCPYTYGASLQLDTCFLRYENSDFLGKSDTSIRYKKCAHSVSSDDQFFMRRDDVLAELEGASGFRVSRSGLIEGFGQCTGDLSSGDCSTCLREAVAKLKRLCGSVAVADVFLGQCYARYWASGYYNSPSVNGLIGPTSPTTPLPPSTSTPKTFFTPNIAPIISWLPDVSHGYSVKSAWNLIRIKNDEVRWSHIVWARPNPPRCSFNIWMTIWKKFSTFDRLRKKNLVGVNGCPLCLKDAKSVFFFM